MNVFKRLLKEFWLPALVALIWTSYNVATSTDVWALKNWVNIFGPSFFLTSWMSGQFFRVRKQEQVEKSFEKITATVVGGDTFPLVAPVLTQINESNFPSGLLLRPRGDHSLYDLTTIVTDIEKLKDNPQRINNYQKRFQLGTLGRAYELVLYNFESSTIGRHTFHIQSFARNGQFNQRLLLRQVDNKWLHAHRITHDQKIVSEYIEPGFPSTALIDLDPHSTAAWQSEN